MTPGDRLIVALDTNDIDKIDWLLCELDGLIRFYKIGMQLVCSGMGLTLAERLIRDNINVFMDLKLLDIENTVEKATTEIANIGAKFLTVHGYPQVIEAAVRGSRNSDLKILAVSVLTSFNNRDLRNAGYLTDINSLVVNRTQQAKNLGAGGVVLSSHELPLVKLMSNNTFSLVTPGIRLPNENVYDQKRTATPIQAISMGADYIVVGRPITESSDPREVVNNIFHNMNSENKSINDSINKL